jgi:hypothetical protein
MQQSLALAAAPALATDQARHVVLLGDSVFDNGAYTDGKPDVLAQLRRRIPAGWKASLLAVDGATIAAVPAQLAKLPRDATDLVLSVGGNNALGLQHLLQAPANSVAEAIDMLASAVRQFESSYRDMIGLCLAKRLPLVICTIYNGNFHDARFAKLARSSVALFNDAIIRIAVEHQLSAIELRLVCARPEDYANPIEPSSIGAAPSSIGAARIAHAIVECVNGPLEGHGARLIGGAQ